MQKKSTCRIINLYTTGLLLITALASGIDIIVWKTLLAYLHISSPSLPYALILTISYYMLLIAILVIVFQLPYMRWLFSAVAGIHIAVFVCNHMYFFQYAAFINREGIELLFQSTGETFTYIKNGISFSQFLIFMVMLSTSVLWVILLRILLTAACRYIDINNSFRLNILNTVFPVIFVITAIILYVIAGLTMSQEKIQQLRSGGTMASNFYLVHRGLLEDDTCGFATGDTKFQKTFTDPVSIAKNNSNIILIVMDSIRADHLPDYGYNRNTTPFIKSLSNELIKVQYCYSQANGTTKSFPSLLLSRYPSMKSSYTDWGLADEISSKGYSIAISSSMDLNWAGIIKMFNHSSVKKIFHAGMISAENRIWGFNLANKLNYGVDDGFNVNEVKSWINKLPQPFFLIIHLHTAHYAYIVPPQYEIFKPVPRLPFRAAPPWSPMLNAYDNAIFRVDDAVKDLFSIFKDGQFLDNSVIALTSDHGEAFDEHPGSYYHQTTVYESQVRVPLFFYIGRNASRAKLLIRQGNNRVTGLVDVIPTLYKASGLGLPEEFQGVPVWGKSNKSFETMISFLVRKEFGIRMNNWKYIRNLNDSSSKLFDIKADPGEKNDIAGQYPDEIEGFNSLYRSISAADYNPGNFNKLAMLKIKHE